LQLRKKSHSGLPGWLFYWGLAGFRTTIGAMKFRLLRRRLTISAPRMTVSSALPWPFRWMAIAVVLGVCAAIFMWAFEFGRDFAGIQGGDADALKVLRLEAQQLRDERDKALMAASASVSVVAAEKVVQEKLAREVKRLEDEGRNLRDDLAFYEQLVPGAPGDGLSIRAFQVQLATAGQLSWQVLLMQPQRHAPEFVGRVEVALSGVLANVPWSSPPGDGVVPVKMNLNQRLRGTIQLPPGVTVRAATIRIVDTTGAVRATQVRKL
jgi:hypothetical protein